MITQLLRFIDIDEETRVRGREIWQILEPHADTVIADFYQRVIAFEVNPAVTDVAIRRLMLKQKEHWCALFGSEFGNLYADSVRRIGIRHRDVELSPMWYVLGYMTLKIAFTEVLVKATLPPIRKGKLLKALDKYVAFDMALALSAYSAGVVD